MTVIFSKSRRADVERFIRSLPGILAGTVPDEHGVADGMRSRVAWALFSEISLAFEVKSNGGTDDAGIKWPILTQQYLAYGRPVTGRKPPQAGKLFPGGKDGFMSEAQLTRWRKIYSWNLTRLAGKFAFDEAKSRAAAIAMAALKRDGLKTKLEVFGNRKVGVDYSILVDTGILRRSLIPGEVIDRIGGAAEYQPSEADQIYRNDQGSITVGTNVVYATYHHKAKKPNRLRELWPEDIPAPWWETIIDSLVSGIVRVGELAEAGQL